MMTPPLCTPPRGSEIVDAAHSSGTGTVLATVHELYLHHRLQWDCEDACRSGGTDEKLGRLKRQIDALNAQRSGCIERIDELLDTTSSMTLGAAGAGVPVHTETFGILIDRIVIASVRVEKLSQGRPHSGEIARWQRDQLVAAYDTLCEEMLLGRRIVPSWRLLKRYGSERKS